jgi:hypothetical protein
VARHTVEDALCYIRFPVLAVTLEYTVFQYMMLIAVISVSEKHLTTTCREDGGAGLLRNADDDLSQLQLVRSCARTSGSHT